MYEFGGRQSLRIAFSVLNDGCGGCPYESYPYTAQVPVRINGKLTTREFRSDKDVWEIVDLIIKETQEFNLKGSKNFDVSESVISQVPFFTCKNKLIDKDANKDVQRYLYCEKFNVPPYEGGYGGQPCLWIEKTFLIRQYLAKLESKQINKTKENGTRKN